MSSESEILLVLERERLARKESERILETKTLEIYEQKLEIETLRKELHEETNRKYLEISRTQSIQQEVFEAHPFSIFIYSLQSLKILNANNTAVLEYGYSKEEFYKLLITDLHNDDDKKGKPWRDRAPIAPARIGHVQGCDGGGRGSRAGRQHWG